MAKQLKTICLYTSKEVHVESEPYTDERADEVLRLAKPFLDSQKRFWRERIIKLFKAITSEEINSAEARNLSVADGGLFWPFHKEMLTELCLAWEE